VHRWEPTRVKGRPTKRKSSALAKVQAKEAGIIREVTFQKRRAQLPGAASEGYLVSKREQPVSGFRGVGTRTIHPAKTKETNPHRGGTLKGTRGKKGEETSMERTNSFLFPRGVSRTNIIPKVCRRISTASGGGRKTAKGKVLKVFHPSAGGSYTEEAHVRASS